MPRKIDHHWLPMRLSPTLHHAVSVEPFSSLRTLEERELQNSSKGRFGCWAGGSSDGPW